jgi:O-antigen/teichoic acid export membrane protein
MSAGLDADGALNPAEVRSRASSGVLLFLGRGVLFRLVGFGSSLVLARLLAPRDFGLVALALTIIGVGHVLADSGLGSSLVRRAEAPTRRELSSLVGFQMVITGVLATVVGVFAVLQAGEDGVVTAVMVASLPLVALRSSAIVLLSRTLEFSKVIRVELIETAVYTVVSVGLALAGAGVWSLAFAQIAKAVVGSVAALRLSPMGRIRPSLDLSAIRPLLGFGVRYQATTILHLVQDIGVTVIVAAVASLTTLGLWSFTVRILQVPQLLFESLVSVAFPAFSRLQESGEDLRPLVERTITTAAVVAWGVLSTCTAGVNDLVPWLFGERWSDVALIFAGSAVALAWAAPSLPAYAYLYAVGDTRSPLNAYVGSTAARLPMTWAFLNAWGPAGIGVAWALSRPFAMASLALGLHRSLGTSCVRKLIAPTIAGLFAGGVGWWLAEELGRGPLIGGLSAAAAAACFVGLMALLDRSALREAWGMAMRLLPGRTPAVASPASAP